MKVFTNTKFKGYFPEATAAVVVAEDHCEAAQLLNIELLELGLDNFVQPCDMSVVPVTEARVFILCDGS